jgi:ankyrin repeat protein
VPQVELKPPARPQVDQAVNSLELSHALPTSSAVGLPGLTVRQRPKSANRRPRGMQDTHAMLRAVKKRASLDEARCVVMDADVKMIRAETQLVEVERLLIQGADPNSKVGLTDLPIAHQPAFNARRFNGRRDLMHASPLQNATAVRRADIVKLLLTFGAHPDGPDLLSIHNLPPLYTSIDLGDSLSVNYLLEAYADIQAHSGYPELGSPLNYAIPLRTGFSAASVEIINCLIQHGADVNAERKGFGSVLGAALGSAKGRNDSEGKHRLNIVTTLLKHGADPNGQTEGEDSQTHLVTAITSAIAGDNNKYKLDTVTVLLKHGADPNRKCPKKHHSSGPEYGTPLIAAIGRPDKIPLIGSHLLTTPEWIRLDIIKKLLEHGADVELFGSPIHPSPLIEAILARRRDLISLFLEQSAGPNDEYLEGEFNTALQAAAYAGEVEDVEKLFNYGGFVDERYTNSFGGHTNYGTPLHAAILAMVEPRRSHREAGAGSRVIKMLIDRGASTTTKSFVSYEAKGMLSGILPRMRREVLTPRELAAKVFLPKQIDRKAFFLAAGLGRV